MNGEACNECGGALLVRGYKQTTQVGKVSVIDGSGMVPVCEACGEPQMTLAMLASYERRAAALVLRDGSHVDGTVVKFARRALGLRQTDLAMLLGKTAETVSRWENGGLEIARAEQLAIVAIIDDVEVHGVDLLAPKARADSERPAPFELEILAKAVAV